MQNFVKPSFDVEVGRKIDVSQSPTGGQPLADKTVILDLAGLGTVGAQIEIAAAERDDRLARRLVTTELGNRFS